MPYDEKSFLNGLAAGLTATVTYPKCDACTGNHIVNVEHGVYFFTKPRANYGMNYFGSGNPIDMLANKPYADVAPRLVKKRNKFSAGYCNYIVATGDATIEKCAFFYGYYNRTSSFLLMPAIKAMGNVTFFDTGATICPCGKVIDDITMMENDTKPKDRNLVFYHGFGPYWCTYRMTGNNVYTLGLGPISMEGSVTNLGNGFIGGYSIRPVGARLFSPFKGDTLTDFRNYMGSNIYSGYLSNPRYWEYEPVLG